MNAASVGSGTAPSRRVARRIDGIGTAALRRMTVPEPRDALIRASGTPPDSLMIPSPVALASRLMPGTFPIRRLPVRA
jgi:hypothetical protein